MAATTLVQRKTRQSPPYLRVDHHRCQPLPGYVVGAPSGMCAHVARATVSGVDAHESVDTMTPSCLVSPFVGRPLSRSSRLDVRRQQRVHDAVTRLSAQHRVCSEHPLALETDLLRHSGRSRVPHELIQLESLAAQPHQGPTAEQANRLCRDAAVTLSGRHSVADARPMVLDRSDSDRTDEPVTGRIGDGQVAAAPV